MNFMLYFNKFTEWIQAFDAEISGACSKFTSSYSLLEMYNGTWCTIVSKFSMEEKYLLGPFYTDRVIYSSGDSFASTLYNCNRIIKSLRSWTNLEVTRFSSRTHEEARKNVCLLHQRGVVSCQLILLLYTGLSYLVTSLCSKCC